MRGGRSVPEKIPSPAAQEKSENNRLPFQLSEVCEPLINSRTGSDADRRPIRRRNRAAMLPRSGPRRLARPPVMPVCASMDGRSTGSYPLNRAMPRAAAPYGPCGPCRGPRRSAPAPRRFPLHGRRPERRPIPRQLLDLMRPCPRRSPVLGFGGQSTVPHRPWFPAGDLRHVGPRGSPRSQAPVAAWRCPAAIQGRHRPRSARPPIGG